MSRLKKLNKIQINNIPFALVWAIVSIVAAVIGGSATSVAIMLAALVLMIVFALIGFVDAARGKRHKLLLATDVLAMLWLGYIVVAFFEVANSLQFPNAF